MPGILTRKLGPFPGWVWAVAAGGGFLLFMYMRGRGRQPAGQAGLPAVSPAASAVPFVPSVTVTGIPPSSQPGAGPGASGLQRLQVRQAGTYPDWDNTHSGVPIRATAGPSATIGMAPFGSTVNATGPPQQGQANEQGGTTWWPIQYGPIVGWLNGIDVTVGTGSGGWGYAGAGSLSSPIGGWTVGWQPFGAGGRGGDGIGSGGPASVNRTGFKRPRRPLGVGGGAYSRESSGFPGGSGGGTTRQQQASAGKPLTRRELSGRR